MDIKSGHLEYLNIINMIKINKKNKNYNFLIFVLNFLKKDKSKIKDNLII